jgi:hypothetical protein
MNKALSTLIVGGRVVVQSFDGALEAEYALFDRADGVLLAAPAKGVRERGYLTTAGAARARLIEAGVTASLAEDAFATLRRSHLNALAAIPSVLRVVDRLGPYEAFEGGRYSAAAACYGGTWLDLDALARGCPLPRAAVVIQALHLILVLEEVGEDTPVRLHTAGRLQGRPGERTWREVSLEGADRLPDALDGMRAPARVVCRDDAATCEMLVGTLRRRASESRADGARLQALAALLEGSAGPTELSDPPAFAPIQPAPVVMLTAGGAGAGATISAARTAAVVASLARAGASRHLAHAVFAEDTAAVWRPELVEKLPLPDGASEEMLEVGTIPNTPLQARIAMTRLARELGRYYRRRYHTALKTNVVAIEAMQRHLRSLFARVPSDPKGVRRLKVELLQHGALLSEIVARSLGADWLDVSPSELSSWTMALPTGQPVWPIGRVYRFFRQGHRESDLVSFYLELEADTKSAV